MKEKGLLGKREGAAEHKKEAPEGASFTGRSVVLAFGGCFGIFVEAE